MRYHHLIEKMKRTQNKIQEHIDKTVGTATLPPDLVEKAAAADVWIEGADMKLGEAEVPLDAPNMDPINAYANALFEYQDIFDEKIRSEIAEYEELVKELFQMIKEPTSD